MTTQSKNRGLMRLIVKMHQWLGLGAALLWLVQAATGVMLSFHFELDDAIVSTEHVATDLDAIDMRLSALADAGGDARVDWIWTTAGLPDRYVVSYAGPSGDARMARIDGGGDILRDGGAGDYSFLQFMRAIHLELLSGETGHIILGVSGLLLVTNLIFGLVVAWPKRGQWRNVLKPMSKGAPYARTYSWHRALGFWAAIPAIFIVGLGSLIMFEHQIREATGAEEIELPANPATGTPIALGRAVDIARDAIPGSRFVGTTLPSTADASYYAWMRAPGELYRDDGYGGSLVVVDANRGDVRGVYPASEATGAAAFMGSLYPLHTGEAGGTLGRILAMAIGVWLVTMIVLGVLLWLRRRARQRASAARQQHQNEIVS